jgi:cyclopropane-fatty-acyl-phospholipid synthase
MPYIGLKSLRAIERAMRFGTLQVITPQGHEHSFAGKDPGPHGVIHIHDWRTIQAALAEGDIGFGNAYMAGWWDSPDLESLLCVLMLNMDNLGRLAWGSPLHRIRSVLLQWVFRRNSVKGSQRNIMAHYDVGNDFYARWLDPTMTYSSALFEKPETDLESGQKAKYARILERLGKPDAEVLEIGCGWGGFTAAAVEQGHRVTALTISPRQHAYATNRIGHAADIRLQDYRKQGGTFSSIVSIEMFEAVGERYWNTYFTNLRERLASNGVAMIQTISISEQLFPSYRTSSDYIRHHIFPGGMLPSISRFKA